MPIVGIIDPTHNERKAAMLGRLPKYYSLDDLLKIAFHAEPKWAPWSYELLKAAIDNLEDRGDSISTTALTGPCPRSTVLERKEPYIESTNRMWRSFRGTMIHYVLESAARPNSIAEVRFFAPMADDIISCKPDLVTADGTLWDYKNVAPSSMPRYNDPWPGHVEQLQFNRYIVSNAVKWEKDDKAYDLPFDVRGMKFNHLAIMYMDIDGPKPLEVEESFSIPTKPGAKNKTKPVRKPSVWTDDRVLEILWPRFKAMRMALESYPVFPSGLEEYWGGEADWKCPGYPHCPLKGSCLASRYPNGLIW